MATWEDVERIALSLPLVHEKDAGTGFEGWRVWKIEGDKGKQVVWERPMRASDLKVLGDAAPTKESIAVRVPDFETKAAEFGARTLVTSAFLPADGKAVAVDPGLSLMRQSDCFNCHAVETQLVGPSFVAIADKYRKQPGAEELLNKKVRLGGSGVWGQVPMLAHPQHTEDEVAIMLRWMLALEKGKGGPTLTRGLEGQLNRLRPEQRHAAGARILDHRFNTRRAALAMPAAIAGKIEPHDRGFGKGLSEGLRKAPPVAAVAHQAAQQHPGAGLAVASAHLTPRRYQRRSAACRCCSRLSSVCGSQR